MKKKIAIIGSTGSIGQTTLSIIKKDLKKFKVELLSSNKNYKLLLKQAKIFSVKNLIIHNQNTFDNKKNIFFKKKINVFNSLTEFKKKTKKTFDYAMCSISGISGLKPTLEIIDRTKEIGIANKIPSILSKTPPWPGNIFPVSLILAFLFKNEINKSPN